MEQNDDGMYDELSTDFFSMRKSSPLWWYHKSCDLRASAGTLWYGIKNQLLERISEELNLGEGRSANTQPVYLMLCGLSLEVLYKAILTQKRQIVPTKHCLKTLANSAGIESDRQKEDLFLILTEAILWDGKYPVPIDKQHQMMVELSSLENQRLVKYDEFKGTKIPRPNNALDWNSFNKFWAEANELFWKNRQ